MKSNQNYSSGSAASKTPDSTSTTFAARAAIIFQESCNIFCICREADSASNLSSPASWQRCSYSEGVKRTSNVIGWSKRAGSGDCPFNNSLIARSFGVGIGRPALSQLCTVATDTPTWRATCARVMPASHNFCFIWLLSFSIRPHIMLFAFACQVYFAFCLFFLFNNEQKKQTSKRKAKKSC